MDKSTEGWGSTVPWRGSNAGMQGSKSPGVGRDDEEARSKDMLEAAKREAEEVEEVEEEEEEGGTTAGGGGGSEGIVRLPRREATRAKTTPVINASNPASWGVSVNPPLAASP